MHVQRSCGRIGHDEGNCDMCNVARAMKSCGNVVKGQDGEEEGAQPMKGLDKGIWTLSKEVANRF